MAENDERPQLRPLEVLPLELEDRPMLALRDPLRLSEELVSVPQESLLVLRMLDGLNTLRDIQAELTRVAGQMFPLEPLREFVDVLDSKFLLDNERYRRRMAEIAEVYLGQLVREPACQDGYPEEAELCTRLFERFCTIEAGPGPIDPACARQQDRSPVLGVIAPHIDYRRGGACYAHAYKALAEGSRAATCVILGTDHLGLAAPLALTDKSFATPYGALPVDRELYAAVLKALGNDPGDQLAHRSEHSIELAAVWLAYVGNKTGRELRILPVLLGSFSECLEQGRRPEQDPRVAALFDALREAAAQRGHGLVFVASADLAHIGPQFGDPRTLSGADLKLSAEADRELLEAAAAGSAAELLERVGREHDKRRICGLAPIYALLTCLEGARGELLQYGQWRDEHGQASVSFGAMSFRK